MAGFHFLSTRPAPETASFTSKILHHYSSESIHQHSILNKPKFFQQHHTAAVVAFWCLFSLFLLHLSLNPRYLDPRHT